MGQNLDKGINNIIIIKTKRVGELYTQKTSADKWRKPVIPANEEKPNKYMNMRLK